MHPGSATGDAPPLTSTCLGEARMRDPWARPPARLRPAAPASRVTRPSPSSLRRARRVACANPALDGRPAILDCLGRVRYRRLAKRLGSSPDDSVGQTARDCSAPSGGRPKLQRRQSRAAAGGKHF